MNVLEKLAEVQQRLAVPKNNTNSFAKYNYRNVEDIEKAVKPLLVDVKATIILDDQIVEVGGRVYVKATAKFLDLEEGGSRVEATAYAREAVDKKGMDDSQLTGATSSYARKYALGGLLLIDNEKDSDSTNVGTKAPQKPSTTATSPRKETAVVKDELTELKAQILTKYKESGKDASNFTDFLLETIGVDKVTTEGEAREVLDAIN
jgi:hypothetical protein